LQAAAMEKPPAEKKAAHSPGPVQAHSGGTFPRAPGLCHPGLAGVRLLPRTFALGCGSRGLGSGGARPPRGSFALGCGSQGLGSGGGGGPTPPPRVLPPQGRGHGALVTSLAGMVLVAVWIFSKPISSGGMPRAASLLS